MVRVRKIYRYGASRGRMISRLDVDGPCSHWWERRRPAHSVSVYYNDADRMVVPWINGEVHSRPRGLPAPEWLMLAPV